MAMTPVEALNAGFAQSGAIRFETRFDGPVACLSHRGSTAIVALQGAQVLSYVPAGGTELLWLSPVARLGTGKAVRGGIPVCWPWFGPHPEDGSKPAHGFVRAALWHLTATSAEHDGVRMVLDFDATAIDPALWPHQAGVTLSVELRDKLKVTLETVNTGSTEIALTQALHTYLAVGEVCDVVISGLDGRRYIDQLDPSAAPVQSGPIRIAAEVDRIYQGSSDTVTVADPSLKRTIQIAKAGSASTVVWNPWTVKGARLGDLGADGYRHFVCIETANAGADIKTLRPGARHSLMQELSTGPLLKSA